MDRECRSNGGKRWARNYADRPADPLRISQRIGFSIEHSRGLARRSMPNDRAGSKTKCNTDTFIAEVLQCPRVTSI